MCIYIYIYMLFHSFHLLSSAKDCEIADRLQVGRPPGCGRVLSSCQPRVWTLCGCSSTQLKTGHEQKKFHLSWPKSKKSHNTCSESRLKRSIGWIHNWIRVFSLLDRHQQACGKEAQHITYVFKTQSLGASTALGSLVHSGALLQKGEFGD